jgi:hypothetical protein
VHEGVINVYNGHPWVWDDPHAICKRGYEVHNSVNTWDEIVRSIVVSPFCFATGSILNNVVNIWKVFYYGML